MKLAYFNVIFIFRFISFVNLSCVAWANAVFSLSLMQDSSLLFLLAILQAIGLRPTSSAHFSPSILLFPSLSLDALRAEGSARADASQTNQARTFFLFRRWGVFYRKYSVIIFRRDSNSRLTRIVYRIRYICGGKRPQRLRLFLSHEIFNWRSAVYYSYSLNF